MHEHAAQEENEMSDMGMTAEELAKAFHEAYERLAPSFGYKTREASAKPWEEVPENNKALMKAVAKEVLELFAEHHRAAFQAGMRVGIREKQVV